MSLITRRRKAPTINIVPLVDVLTVLLFFFLVTMQFKQNSTLNLVLPEIETAGSNQISENLLLAISAQGELYLNNQLLAFEALEQAIQLAGQLSPEVPVLIMADEAAALKHVTRVMDLCRQHQLNQIRLQSR
jgi:biopolymer transport protein ExbD